MKASELRLRNLVLYYNSVREISGIETENLIKLKTKGCNKASVIAAIEEVEPIPLTEEWLLRFGFERCGKDFDTRFDEFSRFGIGLNGQRWYYGLSRYGNTQYYSNMIGYIDYVHQLQNLYFALTGEELHPVEPL